MNKLLAISIASASIAIGAVSALAEVDPKIHKLCIDAKDYAGCVKSQSGVASTNTSFSSSAKSRTKGLKDKLYEFNKRRYIERSPHLAEWVKANPEAAKPIIEKEFLFFIAADLEKLEKEFGVAYGEVSELCLKRGASIDRDFNWKKVCEHTYSYGDDLKAKNELFYRLIQDEMTTQEERIEKEDNCAGLGKKLQRTSAGELCMSDYEYAAFEQRQSDNAANERFRLQLEKDREAERKRRALKDFADSMNKLNESMQPQQQVIIQQPLLQPVQPPRAINCYSNTYGHYTSTSCY